MRMEADLEPAIAAPGTPNSDARRTALRTSEFFALVPRTFDRVAMPAFNASTVPTSSACDHEAFTSGADGLLTLRTPGSVGALTPVPVALAVSAGHLLGRPRLPT